MEVVKYLGLQTDFQESSASYQNSYLRSQERVIDICEKELASQYINPIGGKELYSKNIFKAQNIQLNFIKTHPIKYEQFKNSFVSNLSIIDVLMFNSPAEMNLILQSYELV